MANNFTSNFSEKLAKIFLPAFENARILSKNVDTQLLNGQWANADTGTTVAFKRPTDYVSQRTSDGDVSSGTVSDIIAGNAKGTVQDYFTVLIEYQEADEAIKMAQKGEPGQAQSLLGPSAMRIATDLELDFADYMMKNGGLLAGTVGTAVSTWDHVAEASAVLHSAGVPMDNDWCYACNPYTQVSLASNQRSLGAGGEAGKLIGDAHKQAVMSYNFGGMKVMAATTLSSFTTPAGADKAGVIASNPTVTYVGAKDTMTQDIAVSGFTNSLAIKAGEVVEITGRNRLNLSTRKPVVNGSGSNVLFSGVVTTDVTLSTSGTGTINVAGPAIYESAGAYNTVDSAPVATDVITIKNAASTIFQPNLFWHKQAFSIGSVPIKKLQSTDTVFTTVDGLQMRVSNDSDVAANKQIVRVDLRPAYSTLNPFFAGQGWGSA